MMAQGHRLRRLQMGEAGHHGPGVFFGPVDQRRLQGFQISVQPVQRVAHPQPEVGRHLVVARPGRVQPSGGVADQFTEA